MNVRKLIYRWVDVFAENSMEGNQLAVFTHAPGLKDHVMQSIAREMNLSESIFITGEETSEDGGKVFSARIFTKSRELPFAGHPTLGATHVLREMHGMDTIRLKLKAGIIPVQFSQLQGKAFGEMRQNDPVFGQDHDPSKIATLLRLTPEDLDGRLPVQTVTTGNPFVMVALRKLNTISSINPDLSGMEDYLKGSDAKGFYLTTLDTQGSGAILRSRMIDSDGEDPATGSAAGPAAAWLLKHGILKPRERQWIEQGMEMGRPSRIYVRGTMSEGKPADIMVGGRCFTTGQGEIYLREQE